MTGVGRQHGRFHPEYGPGIALLKCDNEPCGATWVDPIDTPCPWCLEAIEWQKVAAKHDLLWPAWAVDQGPRYDELSDVDKAIWDRTRGITRGQDGLEFWVGRLRRAVEAGLITDTDAGLALERVDRWVKGKKE